MEKDRLHIPHKISRWDEGIPMGNGEIGCLLFGSSKRLVLSLDRGDIWDCSRSPEQTPGFTYENLVKWAKAGDIKSIQKTFDRPYNLPVPTKLPAGRIELCLPGNADVCSFRLDLSAAQATFENDAARVCTFVHATEHVGMMRLNVSSVQLRLVRPKFGKRSGLQKWLKRLCAIPAAFNTNKLSSVCYPQATEKEIDTGNIHIQYFVQPLNDGGAFGIAAGSAPAGPQQTEIAYYAYFSKDAATVPKVLQARITAALKKGYAALFDTHKAWWADYYAQSSVHVPDVYIQNRYNLGNYLLGSASRSGGYPMPLQGLWTACDDKHLPPWKGDYHHDLNTQLTYYSYLKANHLEQGRCYLDYLASLTKRARDFAASFYNADGICLPSVMDIKGYALGGWAMYSLSPTNQLWLCQAFERYYTYTGDKVFLEQTAYPFMVQSARCILSLLREDNAGYYVLPVSSSPEIHDNSIKAFLTPNSNYDQALLLYIFQALSRLADVLQKTQDAQLWRETLRKLRPLAVNENHVLRLSPDEDLLESHRHQSHAMAIHPLRLLDPADKQDLAVIESTVNYTFGLGQKAYTGYSWAWMAEFFTVLKNGNQALHCLETFWKYYCAQNNSFHLNWDKRTNPSERPFTLEGNFCALDALQEMLLYSEHGVIELFPAVPDKWQDLSFKTLRAWGGVLVSAEMADGCLQSAQFTAQNDVAFVLRGAFADHKFHGGQVTLQPDGAQVHISAGETVTLEK